MTIDPKLRLSLFLTALVAASGASAWARVGDSLLVPAPGEPIAITETDPALDDPMVTITEPTPGEEAVPAPVAATPEPAVAARQQPVVMPSAEPRMEPSITITRPRITVDERIQADVIELLAHSPNLGGKIGVVSADSVVTLTGYTSTSGQAWRAGNYARGVEGVKYVVNEIRPRVGGSI